MKKCYILLGLYDELLSGHAIKIDECCSEHNISVSTFRRYIACLREFVAEQHGEEIVYLSETASYVLEKKGKM